MPERTQQFRTVPECFNWVLGIIAVGMTLFHSAAALEIHTDYKGGKPFVWEAHQRWFNFAGSAFGWVGLWVLVRNGWIRISANQYLDVSGWDLLLAGAAFVGVSGYLPFALQVIEKWAAKVDEQHSGRP